MAANLPNPSSESVRGDGFGAVSPGNGAGWVGHPADDALELYRAACVVELVPDGQPPLVSYHQLGDCLANNTRYNIDSYFAFMTLLLK